MGVLKPGRAVIGENMNHKEIEKEKLILRYVNNKLTLDERQAFEKHYSTCKRCQEAVHNEIGRAELIDKFVQNKLSPEEAAFFDEHYFSCERCFKAVKEAEKVFIGVQDAVKRGTLTLEGRTAPVWKLIFERINSFLSFPVVGYASIFLALIMFWQGLRLQSELNDLRQPQAIAPRGYHLLQETDRARGEIADIVLSTEDKVFTLEFTLSEKIDQESHYRAEIQNSRGKQVWKIGELESTGVYEIFTITCLRASFDEGAYILKVYKIKPDQSIDKVFSFPFKIIFKK
jgi:hypothetical protein